MVRRRHIRQTAQSTNRLGLHSDRKGTLISPAPFCKIYSHYVHSRRYRSTNARAPLSRAKCASDGRPRWCSTIQWRSLWLWTIRCAVIIIRLICCANRSVDFRAQPREKSTLTMAIRQISRPVGSLFTGNWSLRKIRSRQGRCCVCGVLYIEGWSVFLFDAIGRTSAIGLFFTRLHGVRLFRESGFRL